ncbi:MAG TPA: prephenate/arogenate dehydrogenase [Leptolyngbyaceae cyanobacterium]
MNIGIVGLGLIGGSLAWDLKAKNHQVLAVSRRPETCQQAIDRGIVDDASVNLSLMAAAELVFVCTPIGSIIPTVEELIPHLSPETIITDVGSVKTPIVEALTPIWPNFVGGHPMAGTAESGLDAALSNLFANRPYVLTPSETTSPEAVKRVGEITELLQAKLYLCRPQEHDRAVSWISHLPVMVSAAAIDACLSETDSNVLELAKNLASSGFRDTSRVGGGNPELGVMMAQYNREHLLGSLQQYRNSLDRLISLIVNRDWAGLENELQRTQQGRPEFVKELNS